MVKLGPIKPEVLGSVSNTHPQMRSKRQKRPGAGAPVYLLIALVKWIKTFCSPKGAQVSHDTAVTL